MEIIYSYKKKIKNINKLKNIDASEEFFKKKNSLYNEKIENIINTFDEISRYWISNQFKLKDLFIKNSLGFIIPWLKKKILSMYLI